MGRALPAAEVKVVDPAGAVVPTGAAGELCTRGYHVMTGCVDAPEQPAEAIDGEGWLHTGDLASMEERGLLRITGRIKDVVARGGENIYPWEVEQAVRPSRCRGRGGGRGPDPTWGEQVRGRPRSTSSATGSSPRATWRMPAAEERRRHPPVRRRRRAAYPSRGSSRPAPPRASGSRGSGRPGSGCRG